MNVLDHIRAGHYPVDHLGRALVPMRCGDTLVVCATDRPGACPIMGYQLKGPDIRGFGYFPDSEFLLPPPPRKRTRYLGIRFDCPAGYETEAELRQKMEGMRGGWVVGKVEFEEPWIK